jgi:hypothetical protein
MLNTMTDPITGQTIRWTFLDTSFAGKTFEHTFGADGGVTFREIGTDAKPGKAQKYEVARITDDVHVVSYLSESGYTLTVVLDFSTKKLVAFASNEKSLSQHHGTFEPLGKMPV